MPLTCGIVGLPNAGKSTLFNSLSSAKTQSASFPFCTIEPNLGTIIVPDQRLDRLAGLTRPQEVIPNTIEIYDIAGLVKGASKGEGLGNQFLGKIREVQAIIHVIRCFEDGNIAHVDGHVDALRDKETIEIELGLKDLETVDKQLDKVRKQSKSGDKEPAKKAAFLSELKQHLEKGKPAREFTYTHEQREEIRELQLLTNKPVLYIANAGENDINSEPEEVSKLKKVVNNENNNLLVISAEIESEIAEIEEPSERQELLKMYDLQEPGVNKLIRNAYRLLDLITFFTYNPKELRGWPLKKGSTAYEAAGSIHTDFQRGFIKAEVMKYADFIQLGSESAMRDNGKINLEGKDYIVEDGDIIYFKFNV